MCPTYLNLSFSFILAPVVSSGWGLFVPGATPGLVNWGCHPGLVGIVLGVALPRGLGVEIASCERPPRLCFVPKNDKPFFKK